MLPLCWQTVFPTWDKAQWIAQKGGSQSGFTITFRLGNPMTQCFKIFIYYLFIYFFCSLVRSFTRQQIQINPVENLKEILGSSCTKLKLLAGSREFYGDWKGTYLGSFPFTCVSACVQMVGSQELSKYLLVHTHLLVLCCESALMRLQLERARISSCPKCLQFSRMQSTSPGKLDNSDGRRGALAQGRLLSHLRLLQPDCNLAGWVIPSQGQYNTIHCATCFRTLSLKTTESQTVPLKTPTI